MVRKYAVHLEGEEPVGYLYYNEEEDSYRVEIRNDLPPDTPMPLYFTSMLWDNKYEMTGELAELYVKEYVIPPNRAGIDAILVKLGLPYYHPMFFIDLFRGRNVMDDFLMDRIV